MSFLGLSPQDLLLLVSAGVPVGMLLIFMIFESWGAKKDLFLYFDTETNCKLLKKKIKDGGVQIGKKTISLDKVRPLTIIVGTLLSKSVKRLYVVKWNKALPLKFTSSGISIISGENLKNVMDNKTLDQLLTPKGGNKMALIYLIMGLVMGGLIGYVISTIH